MTIPVEWGRGAVGFLREGLKKPLDHDGFDVFLPPGEEFPPGGVGTEFAITQPNCGISPAFPTPQTQ